MLECSFDIDKFDFKASKLKKDSESVTKQVKGLEAEMESLIQRIKVTTIFLPFIINL